MTDKYARVKYRGRRLSEMTEAQLREALYQVYAERKSMQEFVASSAPMWAHFDAMFAAFDKIKWPAPRSKRRWF